MTGMDGINSLQKMLGALQVNESTSVNGAAATKGGSSASVTISSTTSSGGVDQASFSAGGLAAQSTDMSDVRTTKVAELRAAIASGTYNVSASAMADKMVEGMLS
jgi:flagellar biosynthesis anti-sigma factor FlgM